MTLYFGALLAALILSAAAAQAVGTAAPVWAAVLDRVAGRDAAADELRDAAGRALDGAAAGFSDPPDHTT
ncbi:MAG: hypothetical protein ABJB98_04510 [Actinomycetota bacterium]